MFLKKETEAIVLPEHHLLFFIHVFLPRLINVQQKFN